MRITPDIQVQVVPSWLHASQRFIAIAYRGRLVAVSQASPAVFWETLVGWSLHACVAKVAHLLKVHHLYTWIPFVATKMFAWAPVELYMNSKETHRQFARKCLFRVARHTFNRGTRDVCDTSYRIQNSVGRTIDLS